MAKHNKNSVEIIQTKTRSVSCDGGSVELGHPKVYLEIAPNSRTVTCPYCSREFELID